MDLVTRFWNFCHTLRHEGIDYSDYIEELTYLLFLKIAEERGIIIPDGCSWESLIINEKEELLKEYNIILERLSKQTGILGDIFSQPMAKIKNSSSLKKLLKLIDEIKWSDYNEDVLGSMFEGLLEKAATESKKGAGQYFTPRPLIDSIVEVMKPDPLENPEFSISDVACGTAGFLISSFEWWKESNHTESKKETKSKVFENTYFGKELVVRPRRMAQMNLYLHGIIPNIVLGDTIYDPFDVKVDGQHDCILTNPPFGNKGVDQIPDRIDFKIKTSNKQLNFIQHVYSCLKNEGRAAIVLPDNVLTEDKGIELLKLLFPNCNIHTILKLPNGTFLPYANVKAIVIFLQKGFPTKETWIYDARTNVESITKKERPLGNEHFKEFIKCYGVDPNGKSKRKDLGKTGRFKKFTLAEIERRRFSLDIVWLEEKEENENVSFMTAEEALNKAVDHMQTIVNDLKSILTIIEK